MTIKPMTSAEAVRIALAVKRVPAIAAQIEAMLAADDAKHLDRAREAFVAGKRARLATQATGVGCKNLHEAGLLRWMWDRGYGGSRKSVQRLIADYRDGR